MSGRHKMPPAGRRKAAVEPVESAEQVSPEPEAAADTAVEEPQPVQETVAEEPVAEESVDAEPEETEETEETEAPDEAESEEAESEEAEPAPARRRVSLPVVLAAIALVLAITSGVFRWLTVAQDESDTARVESVQAAKEITVQMLSYETESVEEQLTAVRERMTGDFLGTYTAMINEVIPAAQAQRIAAVADVLRAGVVSAKPDTAEIVLFVNQSVQVGDHMPEKTPSVARVTMVKEGDRWLMSQYEPVPL
ncbi:hypothetical protein [Mycolicibacterium neworleansense]|uniref:Mce associated membrane protein n=1 Tax=Mycolicibacterium neworleansense TaxID=146018 RepID=A0A0H5RXQ5_9MYCO|nr:hypothetical protein [Mycolicibacterium neworleansense]MCV7360238.1 hypothetical protein [Mycolicibacterium neworleansense]CRZ18282.1 Mce associated membrane protein [Mycolicibacterium neworleansense]